MTDRTRFAATKTLLVVGAIALLYLLTWVAARLLRGVS
jgi:hypothetical protein